MIYAKEDYDHNGFDVDPYRVAEEIQKHIQSDPDIPYAGYSVNSRTGLINFYVKTGDGREFVAFDPSTCSYHVQNDLWISEFDELAIFRLLVIFAKIRGADMFRQFKAMDGNYE